MENILNTVKQFKAKYQDSLIMMRHGDFYNFYGNDAKDAATALGLVLTKTHESNTDFVCFPHFAIDTYLPKLVRAGFKVCICEELKVVERVSK